ncbi:AAA family ATPase [Pseudoduganella sp. FT93W]|uniref:AAA family ATPase n=1 Tax=Duganella fentianensis TaxID=2692177 RepID=A0A845I645_9BURK|nr:AAA family ATPase [Duganella fentianensis]MYN46768.1 AAA family ATPase [Duganella fentianensis]
MSENFKDIVVVERVISQLEGGCIFSGLRPDGTSIRVKYHGRELQPLPDDAFLVEGQLSTYRDRFGRHVAQVNSKVIQRTVHQGALLGPWLSRLPNIGPTRAGRLIGAFGQELPGVLTNILRINDVAQVIQPDKPALAMRIAAQVYAGMASNSASLRTKAQEVEFLTFLEKLGVRELRTANKLWQFLGGPDAMERLARNPYLAASLMDWKIADRIGQRLLRHADPGIDLINHPHRLIGAVNSVWRDVLANGDTAATEDSFMAMLAGKAVPPDLALNVARQAGLLRTTGTLLRAPGAAWLEDEVSRMLLAIEETSAKETLLEADALEGLILLAEAEVGLTLTVEQRVAVAKLLRLGVGVLQGGAGVGKTTVMKVLATAWESLGGNVVMGALAGKAALTLSRGASSPGKPRIAYTIARLIGFLERKAADKTDSAIANADNIQFTNRTLLIIDEAGMMDTPSLHKLLSLLPAGARILIAGDEGQLPPVGIGKVFHDLVHEGSRVAKLTKVLRQAEGSNIPVLSQGIRAGETPALDDWEGETSGVYLVPTVDLAKVQRWWRNKAELMVIAAKKASVADINETESNVRRDSTTATRRLGPLATVAVNDPVVMTANRYQHGLFNGLLGVVTSIEGDHIEVLWDGEKVPRELPAEAEGDIELAYAITCHKAQGSSSEIVVVLLETSVLVTREWLYTAITRARELVLLVGDQASLKSAVSRLNARLTGFTLPALPSS